MDAVKYFLVVVLATSLCQTNVQAELILESSYSFEQKGNTNYGMGMGPLPIDLNETHTTPISTYAFDVQAIPTTPTELKASVGFTVDIDQRNSDTTWESVKVQAISKSSFIDTAFVQGVQGFSGGTIQITWALSGISDVVLDATGPNGLWVTDLATTALLTSSVPTDIPDLFVNDLIPLADKRPGPPGIPDGRILGNAILEGHQPESTGFQTFVVEWSAGQPVHLFFDLEVASMLEVYNFDAAGFHADLAADFSNTATLSQVLILGPNGETLDGQLVGNDSGVFAPAAVPEPSVQLFWGLLACCVAFSRTRRATKS